MSLLRHRDPSSGSPSASVVQLWKLRKGEKKEQTLGGLGAWGRLVRSCDSDVFSLKENMKSKGKIVELSINLPGEELNSSMMGFRQRVNGRIDGGGFVR